MRKMYRHSMSADEIVVLNAARVSVGNSFATTLGSLTLLTVPRRYFCCGPLLSIFGVRVSVTFHLMCVHNILVLFRLLNGHRVHGV